MPTIGWFEILIVVIVSIIVIGPKDFPFMLKKMGSWIGTIKKYISEVQSEVSGLGEDLSDVDVDKDKDKTKHENK